MSWPKLRRAIYLTLGAAGIWLAAIISQQPPVSQPTIPLWHSGINQWTLTNDYTTAVTVSGVTYTVTIKAGFKTDGASIPDSLTGPLGLTRDAPSIIRGALIHDALYQARLLDRQTTDSILYAACLQDGTDPDKARAIYEAVRIWGDIAWGRYSQDDIERARGIVAISEIQL